MIQTSQNDTEAILRPKYSGPQQHVLVVSLGLISFICLCLIFEGVQQISCFAFLSGIFYVLYSYAPLGLALQKVSVLTHAVTSISKRVFVVLFLYMAGQRQADMVNFAGLGVCTAGLLSYVWHKNNRVTVSERKGKDQDNNNEMHGTKRVCLLLLMLVSFVAGITLASAFNLHNPDVPILKKILKLSSVSVEEPQTQISFERRTFSHEGLSKPPDQMLLPNLTTFSQKDNEKWSKFVNRNLVEAPHLANSLMSHLTTSQEIIREAQRVQFNIFGRVLANFKYAMWFDIAAFENKGDSCVTSGEAYMMKRLGIEVIFFCHFQSCTANRLDQAKAMAQNYNKDELVILGRGGGNLIGYYDNDEIRFTLLDLFPEHQIVIFPQGIWVPEDNLKAWHVQKCMKRYCCNPNLTIVLREMPSYKLAKQIFKGSTRLLLAPDSAFQFGPIPRFMNPVFDILWLKRDDKEGTPGFVMPKFPSHLRVHLSQWWRWKTAFGRNQIERAYYLSANGFMYLQRARVVITDRLHGHIVCVLLNIPHVLLDPKGRKVTKFHYTWTKSFRHVTVAKDPEEAMRLAVAMVEDLSRAGVLPPRMPFLHLREGTSRERNADDNPQSLP